jgi:prohibitin 2
MRNPFKRSGSGFPYGSNKRTTPEGEPLEGTGRSRSIVRIVVPIIIGVIIISVIAVSSVRIVDAGNRGILVQFGNVATENSLDEGLHFVVPFRDNVVQIEVRTQKIVESATSASKDLQDVSTQVALNYHINPDRAQVLYQQLGPDYANRVIVPAIQESVKQVTARFNAEELITKRETVKNQIEEQITARLGAYNIVVDALSITEFQFSPQFTAAVEAKVEAQQRALQAQNELRRIQIEAQQNEAQAIGEQKANIARAEGIKQSNVLQAEGEAQAITLIDAQLRNNPTYLEWLKATKWDGVLPLVTGGGSGGQGNTPFIDIPTAGNNAGQEGQQQQQQQNQTGGGNQTVGGQEGQQQQQQQNQTDIGTAQELENFIGLSNQIIANNTDIGSPNATTMGGLEKEQTSTETTNMSSTQQQQQQQNQTGGGNQTGGRQEEQNQTQQGPLEELGETLGDIFGATK